MVAVMSDYRIPVTYVFTDGTPAWETEDAWIPPVVGQGVIDEGGRRYRVVDVWVNREKHGGGVGEYGVYVYIEEATGPDDRPGELHSAYYRAHG